MRLADFVPNFFPGRRSSGLDNKTVEGNATKPVYAPEDNMMMG